MLFTREVDKHGEDGVDSRSEKDWCDDDEEVLDDEVGDFVGIEVGGEGAEDVADDFLSSYISAHAQNLSASGGGVVWLSRKTYEDNADDHGAEVPISVLEELPHMCDAGEEEENDA